MNYHWPGNLSELQNTLQRYISTKRLDFMRIPTGCNQDNDPRPNLLPDTPQDHRTDMQEFEKRLIVRALEQNNWHWEKAAQSLKIPRRTLR